MSDHEPIIALLCGGTSAEREVSLGSGQACALALARSYPTRIFEINADALPAGLDPQRHVVFSTLHGGFGESGGMQGLLDAAGVHYAGCGAGASALTMDKTRTKQVAARRGVNIARGIQFPGTQKPAAGEVIAQLGGSLVVKPNDEGSSVGLRLVTNRDELESALAGISRGQWLIEQRIVGRELSVGVLDGRAAGVVEIRPKSGIYDFTSKYTKGHTEYFAPAEIGGATALVQGAAEAAFAACGCRDYARVDFILSETAGPVMLEINTLPGMKETSLLPMSAGVIGLSFEALLRRLVAPAIGRFHAGVPAGVAVDN